MNVPGPKVLLLTETGPPLITSLTQGQVASLVALGSTVSVTPAPGGLWKLGGNQRVGVLQTGTGPDRMEIRIRPKMPIRHLLHLLGHSASTGFWRNETVAADYNANLEEVIVELYAQLLAQALEQGVLHGYRHVEDETAVVRGRIRTAAMLRRGGLPLPIPVAFDDFTADTDENRILLAAARRCRLLPGLSEQTRSRLRHLADKLSAVSELSVGAPPPRWTPSRLNQRYQPALYLAEMILKATIPDPTRGAVASMNGFVIDMEDVFERFLTLQLRAALAAHGLCGRAQEPRHRLDEAKLITIKPDITVYQGSRLAAFADAKYAKLSAGKPANEHIYQMVAYCAGLGLVHGHLVYAGGEPALTTHTIKLAGLKITAHALDLEMAPDQITAQIATVAESIVHSIGDGSPAPHQP